MEKPETSQRAEQNLARPWQWVPEHCQPPSITPEPLVSMCRSRITAELRQTYHWNRLCSTWKQQPQNRIRHFWPQGERGLTLFSFSVRLLSKSVISLCCKFSFCVSFASLAGLFMYQKDDNAIWPLSRKFNSEYCNVRFSSEYCPQFVGISVYNIAVWIYYNCEWSTIISVS